MPIKPWIPSLKLGWPISFNSLSLTDITFMWLHTMPKFWTNYLQTTWWGVLKSRIFFNPQCNTVTRYPRLPDFKFRPQLHHLVSHHAASCSLEALRTEQPFSRGCSSSFACSGSASNGALLCWYQIASLYLSEDSSSIHTQTQRANRRVGVWHHSLPTVNRERSARHILNWLMVGLTIKL